MMAEAQKKVDSWLRNLVHGTYRRPLSHIYVEFGIDIQDGDMFFELTEIPDLENFLNLTYKCIFTAALFSSLCELSPLLRYDNEKFSLHIVGSTSMTGDLQEVNRDVILMLTENMGISLRRSRLYCLQGLHRPFAKMDLVGGVHWEVIGRISVGTTDGCQLCKVAFTPTSTDLLPRSVLLSRDLSVFPNMPKMTQEAVRNVSEFLPSAFCEFEQSEITVEFSGMLCMMEDYSTNYEYSYSGSFKKLQQVYSADVELNRHSSTPWDSMTTVLVQKHEWRVGEQPSEDALKFVEVACYDEVY
jgi:hypothetical protein